MGTAGSPPHIRSAALAHAATILSPAAFGAAYVLLTFTALPTTLADLVRPLILIAAGTVVLTLVFALLLRNMHWAVIIASALILAASAPFVFVSAAVAGLVVLVVQVVRRKWTWAALRAAPVDRLSRVVSVFASGYLVVAFGLFLPQAVSSIASVDGRGGVLAGDAAGADSPNVYLLLLDGYPRSDTLAAVFDHDNRPFERELQQRGFRVAAESRSNYAHSWVSLATLLQGDHIEDIPGLDPPPTAPNDQFRALMVAINEGRMLQVFRDHGYSIAAIPPPHQSLGLSTADDYRNSEHLTDFEYSLLIHSQIGRAVMPIVRDFIADQVRGRFQATMSGIESQAREHADRPTLLLAHVHSPPHAPLVFGADGEPLPLDNCVPVSCRLWEYPESAWSGLSDQITYLNGRVLGTIDEIVHADPGGVIILMADHGARYSSDDVPEYFRIFFAARTPGTNPFPPDVHSVNVLRHLADAYLDTGFGAADHRTWFSPVLNQPLNLQEFDR
jgi:hypothetical protein